MKVLFVDDCNMNESEDPIVDLVDVQKCPPISVLQHLESEQTEVGRHGGSWQAMMRNGCLDYIVLKSGRFSDVKTDEYEMYYKLIRGNY